MPAKCGTRPIIPTVMHINHIYVYKFNGNNNDNSKA